MLGYALFLIPMMIAFVWVSIKRTVKQALLDLIAFNVLFNFDFSALLPNDTNLLLLHVLVIALVGLDFARALISGRLRTTRRVLWVLAAVILLLGWLSVATMIHRMPSWGVARTLNYVIRGYLLNGLFFYVGLQIATRARFERFGKILLVGSAIVGAIAIVQTVSGGALLTSDRADTYLGIFQPLGDKAIGRRDQAQAVINYIEIVKTIRFGGLSFYRASGTFEGAYVTLCMVALATLCLLTSKERRITPWLFLPLFLTFAGFVGAFNRTAIVTFVVLGLFVLLVRFPALLAPRVLLRWFVPLACAALLAVVFIEPLSNVVAANLDGFFGSRGSREVASLNGRSTLWAYVFSEIRQHPIFGSGQSITLYRAGWGVNDNSDIDVSTHNSFFEFAYRGGLVPGILFVVLVSFCLLRSWALSRDRRLSPHDRLLFFVLFIVTSALVLLNFTASMIIVPQVVALIWILCGYLARCQPVYSEQFALRSHRDGVYTAQPVG
jgi:F0F1-type ATP synthase membrane subunit c/vacuolar-type H+-ATPase subunit K